MSVVSLIKPKREVGNVPKPRIHDVGTNLENKLTFETLLKFIEENKSFILNPTRENNAVSKNSNYNNVVDSDEIDVETDSIVDIIDKNSLQKKLTMLNLGDSCSIDFLPDNLKLVLSPCFKQMFRFGIKTDREYNFIQSYIISILMCIKSSFSFLSKSTYEEFNNYAFVIITMVFQHIRSNDMDFKNYNDKNYEKAIYSHTIFTKFMRHVADLLHVNIFVIDHSHDILLFVNKNFNKYRMNIFLFQLADQYYEPVFFNEKKFIAHNHPLIIELMKNPKSVTTSIDSKFEHCEENIDSYIKEEKLTITLRDKMLEKSLLAKNRTVTNNNSNIQKPNDVPMEKPKIEEPVKESADIKCAQDKEIVAFDKKKLEKKSATEIRDLAESLSIDTNNKTNNGRHKTKIQLIDEIINVNKK